MRPRAALSCASAGVVAVIGLFACDKPQTTPSVPLADISGHIEELGSVSLPGATVTLVGGVMDGYTRTTDQNGNFSFADAVETPQLRVTKSGYVTATQNVVAHRADVTLSPTVPYADVGGTYQVALTASPSCQLPDDARTRAYSAAVAQDSARLTITFSGAQFASNANTMDGRIYSNSVNLNIGTVGTIGLGYDCVYFSNCFIENLSGGRTLTLNGTGSGTASGSTIDVQLAGVLSVTGVSRPATCSATDHHLTFSR